MEEIYNKLAGINIENSIMQVYHKNLEDYEPRKWKKICPRCKVGLLLVGRNQENNKLLELDHCVLCGQKVRYLDIEEMRKQDGM